MTERRLEMFREKITRREFLKTALTGILAVLALPLLRFFGNRNNISHKDARYYKNLSG